MEKLARTIQTALHLAHSSGIEKPDHIDQLIGAMVRKLADGIPDHDIYGFGRSLSKVLADQEQHSDAIQQLIDQVKRTGNPLTHAQAI